VALKQYFDAKRNLENLSQFRRLLELKIGAEKIDEGLPKTMPVEIVDRAKPPSVPAWPNRYLVACLFVLGSFLALLGGCFCARHDRQEP
jgi:hypothetical protein